MYYFQATLTQLFNAVLDLKSDFWVIFARGTNTISKSLINLGQRNMLVRRIKIFPVSTVFLYILIINPHFPQSSVYSIWALQFWSILVEVTLFHFFHINSTVPISMYACTQKILSTSQQFMEVTSLRPSSKLSFISFSLSQFVLLQFT